MNTGFFDAIGGNANQLDSTFKPICEPAAATAMEYASGLGETAALGENNNKRLDQFVG